MIQSKSAPFELINKNVYKYTLNSATLVIVVVTVFIIYAFQIRLGIVDLVLLLLALSSRVAISAILMMCSTFYDLIMPSFSGYCQSCCCCFCTDISGSRSRYAPYQSC